MPFSCETACTELTCAMSVVVDRLHEESHGTVEPLGQAILSDFNALSRICIKAANGQRFGDTLHASPSLTEDITHLAV